METAGKSVEDEELRDALKENGIGRPSTRAAIIETLFKRHYIRKERKNLVATQTGVELIGTIRNELLKSAELTGIWENKLRKIERKEYRAADFLEELKMVGRNRFVRTKRQFRQNHSGSTSEEPKKKINDIGQTRKKKTTNKTSTEKKPKEQLFYHVPYATPAISYRERRHTDAADGKKDAVSGCHSTKPGTLSMKKRCKNVFKTITRNTHLNHE